MIERTNRIIPDKHLSNYVEETLNDWAHFIQTVILAYEPSIHAKKKYSPFYLNVGHPYFLLIDYMFEATQTKFFASPSNCVKNSKNEFQKSTNW